MPLKNINVTSSSFQILLFISYLAPLLAFPNDSGTYYYSRQHDEPFVSHSTSGIRRSNHGVQTCILDERWKGKWFQTGYPQPISIDNKSIGPKGICLDKSGDDKFLFFYESTNCHKCVVINERHRNILQYKESQYCEDKNSLETLCSLIPGDGPLYSLFRIDAQPVDCPFKDAPYAFTYNRGHGECSNPVSNIDECTETSRLLIRYQACPDIPKTESTIEELECFADWKEGSNHYMIGKLESRLATNSHEERYRCFLYEKIKNHTSINDDGYAQTIGYRVAQSGDASCTGIYSPTDGARSLILTKVEQTRHIKCRFPNWVLANHWQTLDGKISVKTHPKNLTIYILNESKKYSKSYANFIGTQEESSDISILINGVTRFVCLKRFDISEREVKIVAQRTKGCKTESVCMSICKRDHHVIEMKISLRSGQENNDCEYKSTEANKYTTLVSASASQRRCPQLGKYLTTTTLKTQVSPKRCIAEGQGSYKTLVVGCGNRGTMEFYSRCSTEEPIITSYMCHGNWEESGTGYFIATPLSRSSNSAGRYCFIYRQTEGGLRVSRNSETCRTNLSPDAEGFWSFNLTVDAQCAEPLTTGSSINNRVHIHSLYSILYFVIFMILNSPISISSLDLSNNFLISRSSSFINIIVS